MDGRNHNLVDIHEPVGKGTQDLSPVERLHDVLTVRALHTHGNHPDVHITERSLAVTHQRRLLTTIHQHVAGLAHVERVTQYLTAADVGTQLDESLGLCQQRVVGLLALISHLELMPGIHRKLVDHRLSEQTVVPVRCPPRLQAAILPPQVVVTIGQARPRTENQRKGNHADGHEAVEHADIQNLQTLNQRAIQPLVTVSFAVYTMISHLSSAMNLWGVFYRHPSFVK